MVCVIHLKKYFKFQMDWQFADAPKVGRQHAYVSQLHWRCNKKLIV